MLKSITYKAYRYSPAMGTTYQDNAMLMYQSHESFKMMQEQMVKEIVKEHMA